MIELQIHQAFVQQKQEIIIDGITYFLKKRPTGETWLKYNNQIFLHQKRILFDEENYVTLIMNTCRSWQIIINNRLYDFQNIFA